MLGFYEFLKSFLRENITLGEFRKTIITRMIAPLFSKKIFSYHFFTLFMEKSLGPLAFFFNNHNLRHPQFY